MDELRGFVKVDNHEAVRIADLGKDSEVLHVVGPKFNTRFPRSSGPRRGGRLFEEMKKACCAPASMPPVWVPADRRLWTKAAAQSVATQSVKQSSRASRERSGKDVPQVCGDEQGSQCSPEWKQ